jgi:GTP-binding protein YchF
MALSVGIVGLPNAGKSTLFNALTQAGALVGNYPYTTTQPKTGVVGVPDPRLDRLAAIFSPPRVIPATVSFTDIAGLIRGASRNEGMGNEFLGHIRDCDAIVLVARGFVEGAVDPVRDVEVIELELELADLETVTRRLDRREKTSRLQKEKAEEALEVMRRVRDHLDAGEPVRTLALSEEERGHIHELYLLTSHPLIVVVNVGEADAAKPPPDAVVELARRHGGDCLAISARIESEIVELPTSDRREFLASLGLPEPGLNRLARDAYGLLDLITFFTAGEKEVRAWTLQRGGTAVEAAGVIHTDFARGFIRAEVVGAEELIEGGSYLAVREQGRQRLEGRDYVVQDGDVVHFRVNV